MAAKPLTTEAIALTEKKMDMTLDAIIEMNKKKTNPKVNNRRASNKSQKPFTPAAGQGQGQGQGNNAKLRRFMDSRSALRQGALNQRRSNFQRNQFPIATEAARKAAATPIRNRPFNRNRTANWNNPRVAVPPVQRMVVGYAVGKKQSQQARMLPKQRPQTLDSLFANLKEQRMRVQQNISQQNMARQNMTRRAGVVGAQTRRGRGRFGNYTS